MAFNTSEGRATYTALAAQTEFTFTFKVFTTADIKVYKTPSGSTPDDTTDLLTITTDYTVSINGDNGGTITLLSGATAGDTIVLMRDLSIKRDVDFQDNGDLLAATINSDQNYQTYLIQQMQTYSDRSIKLQDTSIADPFLPAPSAGKLLRWNTSADGIDDIDPNSLLDIPNATTVGTIAALRVLLYAGQSIIFVTGYYTSADNIGVREYYWDYTSTEADNGGTIIQVTGVVTGRWKMKYSGAVNVKWFGAKGDGITDDTVSLLKITAFQSVFFPSGRYLLSEELLFNGDNITITGEDNSIISSNIDGSVHLIAIRGTLLNQATNITIENLGFSSQFSTKYCSAIELNFVRNAYLNNLRFEKMNICVLQNGVSRSTFSNFFDFKNIYAGGINNYIIKNLTLNLDADNTYSKIIMEAGITHIDLRGDQTNTQDGVNISECIFFSAATTCLHNIVLFHGYWGNITNNKLFEANETALVVANNAHMSITGNKIAWCGQRAYGHGIWVYNTTPVISENYGGINISNNIIEHPSASAIYCQELRNLIVSSNTIVQPNSNQHTDTLVFNSAPLSYSGIIIDSCRDAGIYDNKIGGNISLATASVTARVWKYDVESVGENIKVDVKHFPSFCAVTPYSSYQSHFITKDNFFSLSNSINRLNFANTFASWTASNLSGTNPSIIATNISSPFGTLDATNILFGDGSSGYSKLTHTTSIVPYIGYNYVFSIWLKSTATTRLALRLRDSNDLDEETIVITVSENWTRYYICFIPKVTGTLLYAELINEGEGSKTIYASDAKLEITCDTVSTDERSTPSVSRNLTTYGSSAPSVGYSYFGDRCINSAPSVGSPKAWICTASGSPGTWVSEGNL